MSLDPEDPKGFTHCAGYYRAVTLHDSNVQNPRPRALRANTAGDIVINNDDGGSDVTITVSAGEVIYLQPAIVKSTGTTATVHGYYDS